MSKRLLTVFVIAFLAPQASFAAGEPGHTMEWYRLNDDALQERLKYCEENPDEADTTDCVNAKRAETKNKLIGEKGKLKSPKFSLD